LEVSRDDIGGHHGDKREEVVPNTDIDHSEQLVEEIESLVRKGSISPEVDPDVSRKVRLLFNFLLLILRV
jgi:hypothetical protein